MSALHDLIACTVNDYLNRAGSVDGYPCAREEWSGRRLYRIWDGTVDLDRIVAEVVDSLRVVKELRCGAVTAVDAAVDVSAYLSGQHRYVTRWIGS